MSELTSVSRFEVPPLRRPGLVAWWQFVLAEMRSVVRDTAGLVVPIGMPVLLLVSQGLGLGASEQTIPEAGGRSVLEVYVVPVILVMVIGLVGVVNMPSFLATYRKSGLLKRLSATPASPFMVLVAQVVTSVVQTAVGIGLALGVAALVFGLDGPENLPVTVGVVVLVSAAMYAVGMLVAALAPTTNAAIAVGLLVFFAMGASGGMFGSTENLPEAMARVGEALPYGAGVQALQAAWLGGDVETAHLVALGLAVVLGATASVRFFRWTR